MFTFGLVLAFASSTLAQVGPANIRLDSNGWTIFTRSADTRIIYVSSSTGSDANNGQSERLPVKTIARGVSFLRPGFPDWLLLKKGDTWINEDFGAFQKHGRSAVEPMLISSYGTGARPLIKTKGTAFVTSHNNSNGDDLALVGIEFSAYMRDPNSSNFANSGAEIEALYLFNPITWFLMEDCKFSFYTIDVAIFDPDGTSSNVIIRRNIFADTYGTKTHAQGLYVDRVSSGLVIEENLFDHNGWNASVPGAEATIFNHNLYLQTNNGPVTVRGNIFANAASHGAQVRPGGFVTDNLFVANPLGLLIGNATSRVSDNVILEGNDIVSAQGVMPRAFGIDVNPGSGSILVGNNIISNEASEKVHGRGISVAAGTSEVTVTNNTIYKWGSPITDRGAGNITSPNAINETGYPDPGRTVETYNATLGGSPSLSAFLAEARKQSKDNWRPQFTAHAVNNYIRAGFGVGAIP
jgi:hypothetical protein